MLGEGCGGKIDRADFLKVAGAGALVVSFGVPGVARAAATAGGPYPDLDPTQLDWANSVLATADDGTGNQVRYIVHRLCQLPNVPSNSPAQHCADAGATGDATGQSHGGVGYPGPGPSVSAQPFFRISSQVTGPKNTVSYIQVVMQ